MKHIRTYLSHLSESISVQEAARDMDAIQTILDGKRDLGYIAITTQKIIDPRSSISALGLAINNGLNLIPLRGREEGVAFIVWKEDAEAAQKLAQFAESKGGYLRDDSPEEAQFIGRALNYNEDEITQYVNRNYGK